MSTTERFALTTAEWREELRRRAAFALRIATENERAYGPYDIRTRKAFKAYDAFQAVIRNENA